MAGGGPYKLHRGLSTFHWHKYDAARCLASCSGDSVYDALKLTCSSRRKAMETARIKGRFPPAQPQSSSMRNQSHGMIPLLSVCSIGVVLAGGRPWRLP